MNDRAEKKTGFLGKSPLALLLRGAVLLLLLALGTALWVRHGLGPLDEKGKSLNFVVKGGDTLSQVSQNLKKDGLIRSSALFGLAGRFMDYDRSIKTGEYRLNSAMSSLTILETLKKGEVINRYITIPEGFNVNQIARLLAKEGLTDGVSFLELSRDKSLIEGFGFSGNSLEGYLFPDTYRFMQKEDARKVITVLTNRFKEIIGTLEPKIKESGMTLQEIVTLASIVEKETAHPDERPLIARVFLNRLKRNMRLESDPTVIYGMVDFNGNITKKDLKTRTPYNTYVIKGLPPGPIASPGLAAILAVLNPAEGNYYYFVSKNNGTHHFSETLKEHNRAVKRYQKGRSKKRS